MLTADLAGRTFGRLTVTGLAGIDAQGRKRWLCRCSCGGRALVLRAQLLRGPGGTRSCGCMRSELAAGLAAKRMAKRAAQETSHA